jgi:DNA-binding transcriptional regulator YiaG
MKMSKVAAPESKKLLVRITQRLKKAATAMEKQTKALKKAAQHAAHDIDVAAIRKRMRLTPAKFAALIGVSVAVLGVLERRRRMRKDPMERLRRAARRGSTLLRS